MWVNDPVTNIKSVSLTLALFITVVLTTAGLLQVWGKVTSVGPFVEMFWGSWALYLGRRLSFGGKTYSSDKSDDNQGK